MREIQLDVGPDDANALARLVAAEINAGRLARLPGGLVRAEVQLSDGLRFRLGLPDDAGPACFDFLTGEL